MKCWPDGAGKVSKSDESAGMLTLKYANKCKIGVNGFKKYDLYGKIIKLKTLCINKISCCYGFGRTAVSGVDMKTGESGYE